MFMFFVLGGTYFWYVKETYFSHQTYITRTLDSALSIERYDKSDGKIWRAARAPRNRAKTSPREHEGA